MQNLNTKRNITTDNFFTSLSCANKLYEKDLRIVGTLRKKKAEIQNEFLPSNKRKAKTCLFGFNENNTLVSFFP